MSWAEVKKINSNLDVPLDEYMNKMLLLEDERSIFNINFIHRYADYYDEAMDSDGYVTAFEIESAGTLYGLHKVDGYSNWYGLKITTDDEKTFFGNDYAVSQNFNLSYVSENTTFEFSSNTNIRSISAMDLFGKTAISFNTVTNGLDNGCYLCPWEEIKGKSLPNNNKQSLSWRILLTTPITFENSLKISYKRAKDQLYIGDTIAYKLR